MDYFVVQKSRHRYLVPLIGSLVVLGSSVFVLLNRGPSWIVWTAIVIFGSSAVYLIVQLFDTQPSLVISDDGIFDPNWRIGTIPWRDLRDAYIRSDSGKDFVCLSLLDPEKYRGRLNGPGRIMNAATRATGFGDFSLNAFALGLDAKAVLELVTSKLSQANEIKTRKKER